MKIVLTGKMAQTRDQEYKKFTNYGITVMKAVSGNVDYLVTGERPGQKKIRTAKAIGIPIITEEVFFELLMEMHPEMLL
jgi:DNA ligase (NAD+)